MCLKAQLEETSAALDAAHRLSEQLDRKEAMISALRDEGTAVCLMSCRKTYHHDAQY